MGTTLTGTTPQDTYDSLIKVTDNGPLSGTLKALSDGLGNDSSLSLSTTAASISGALGATGDITLTKAAPSLFLANNSGGNNFRLVSKDTGEFTIQHTGVADLVNILTSGNVGIGTSAPEALLHVNKSTAGGEGGYIYLDNPAASTLSSNVGIKFGTSGGASFSTVYTGLIQNIVTDGSTGASDLVFGTFDGATSGERDTAAANALDDYEEGEWTMGIAFGGASVGLTYGLNTGTYTKIGRKVTVNGYLTLTSKGSSTGDARITGLPFTIANTNGNFSAPSFWLAAVQFTNQFQGYATPSTTRIELWETTTLGVSTTLTNADFANTSEIMVSLNLLRIKNKTKQND
jgi:hypothetical protein